MKKLLLLMMCVLMGVMMLVSCSSENLLAAATDDDEVNVTVNCDSPRGWDIAKYVVTATDSLGNKKTSESATATLSIKLKKGVWSFVVCAYDSASTELYKGAKDSVDLSNGTATSFSVMIIKQAGSASIDISAYWQTVGSTPTSINVTASKSGFDSVKKTLSSFTEKAIFEDLALGEWTFTTEAVTSSGNVTCGSVKGTVSASALITLAGTYTTTTVGGGTTPTTVAPPVTGGYYWTNKDGHYGTNKTISSFSDWTENEKIVQGAANDDPRVFCHWSMHENPNDAYALYAAYDDTNLYLMVELANVQDIVAPGENYPLSDNGQFWNRGTPFFFAFDTGKGVGGDGSMIPSADPYVWNSAVSFSAKNVDTMIVCHSNPGKGTPGVFYTDNNGLFSYSPEYLFTFQLKGVDVKWDGGENKTQGLVSSNLWGIRAVGMDQGRLAENVATDTYIDFNTLSHDKNLDLKWQITIPLATLRITKSELVSNGIGVMFVLSDGASGMDCLPWDPTMINNAATPYSKDESSSAEKEDVDVITVPFARIGK